MNQKLNFNYFLFINIMPYTINKYKTGFRVCKKDDVNKCFSKKPLTKTKATKQMKAIIINEASGAPLVKREPRGKPGAPKNQKLYDEVKKEVYSKNKKHSLFRSALIQKIYRERGGTYEDTKNPKMNINKWFKQQWISLNDFLRGKNIPCGSSNTEEKYKEYPLCRPLEIARKLTKPQIKQMIDEKNKLKEKPLKTKSIIGTDKLNIKPTMSGLGAPKIKKPSNKLLLLITQKVAQARGYDPKKLRLSKDKIHKLEYNDGKKWIKFGRVGYNDFPTYMYNHYLGNITYDEAVNKMRNYRKRAMNIKGNWKNNKYSPNNLAINILW